jgi:methionine sulfoxide reductase catalytic subunit
MTDKYQSIAVRSSEITPHSLYLSRREFLKAAGVITGSTLLVACTAGREATAFPAREDEFGDRTTSFEEITHYNNYYEFSESKRLSTGSR